MNKKQNNVQAFLDAALSYHNADNILTRNDILSIAARFEVKIPGEIWKCSIGRNMYSLQRLAEYDVHTTKPAAVQPNQASLIANIAQEITVNNENDKYIPLIEETFIPYGINYSIIDKVITAGMFFPVYIYGVSGVGKTTFISQCCAQHKRPLYRAQISKETIDEDLIGCMKLENGNTVWQDGPVMMAYRTGGVLLLDEIDLNNGIMVLQPILENQPFLIKQTGELVRPAPGFTVFATGNTKGDGADHRFIGTTVLNDAFKDRFALMLKQEFPPISVEKQIIKSNMKQIGVKLSNDIMEPLLKWVDMSRKTYSNGELDVYISTRRIMFVIQSFILMNDITAAIALALGRYDDESVNALKMLWTSLYKNS